MLWFIETWLRGWLSVKDADSNAHTHIHPVQIWTGVTERLHDLVTDKCSRITGSQCNQIISNRLSGLLMCFPPYSRGLSLVAVGYEEDATILEQWQQNKGALSHLPPWQNNENDKCERRGVMLCFRGERSHNFTPLSTLAHFSHDQSTPLLFQWNGAPFKYT